MRGLKWEFAVIESDQVNAFVVRRRGAGGLGVARAPCRPAALCLG
jgi:hypothetical protein